MADDLSLALELLHGSFGQGSEEADVRAGCEEALLDEVALEGLDVRSGVSALEVSRDGAGCLGGSGGRERQG